MSAAVDLLRAVPFHTVRAYTPTGHLPFVVVFLPRTGSNLLAAMLDSHPDVICHHELFNAGEIHRSLSYKHTSLDFGSVAERDQAPYDFVKRVFAFAEGQRAVGFKISPGQNNAVLMSLLLSRRVRKILLERRNWLQAFTSARIAEQTQVWSVATQTAQAAPKQRKVHVDVGDLGRFIRKRQLFHRLTRGLLRATGQRFVTVEYDEIGTPAVVTRVLSFLDVDPAHPLEVRTVKQNPTNLRDRIENYDELARSLADTPLARLLDPTATNP